MAKTTKLSAVNIILSNIGQSPVTTLDTGNPLVEMAELVLDEITRSVQAEGWEMNTERNYPFPPNTDNEILIPDNVLGLDETSYNMQATIRNGKLYDRVNHTYEFTGVQSLDVLWEWTFEELPEPFKNYITIRAANVFAGRSVGSTEAVRFGQQEEMIARATVLEYDTQQGNYSVFMDRDGNLGYNERASRSLDPLYRI